MNTRGYLPYGYVRLYTEPPKTLTYSEKRKEILMDTIGDMEM